MRWWKPRQRESLDRVLDLHGGIEVAALAGDCADGTCDHDDATECPTILVTVCNHCFHLAHPDGMFDDFIEPDVVFPCYTRRQAGRSRGTIGT